MTSSAVKIPDLKSVPPGFTKTFQRGYRSVVETNSSAEAPQPLGACCLLKSFWSQMLPQRELLSHKTSRPSCTCGSSAPCGVTALGGSTRPSHVFWPAFSKSQVGDREFQGMLLSATWSFHCEERDSSTVSLHVRNNTQT